MQQMEQVGCAAIDGVSLSAAEPSLALPSSFVPDLILPCRSRMAQAAFRRPAAALQPATTLGNEPQHCRALHPCLHLVAPYLLDAVVPACVYSSRFAGPGGMSRREHNSRQHE